MPALWLSLLLLACGDPKHGRRASPVIEPTWVVCGNAVATLSGYDDVAVLLVMDRSRSMSWDGKWGTTRGAVERALKTNSGLLRVGLLMFPRAADVCAVEATLDVPFAQDNGAAIGAADFLGGAHDDGAMDIALLHLAARNGFLDGHDDDVAHFGCAALRATQHLDALHPARA